MLDFFYFTSEITSLWLSAYLKITVITTEWLSFSYPHFGSLVIYHVAVYAQGAMAATYSALKNSQPTPELKPIESSFLAQRRVKKLPSTSL